jgi:hypothetical protein
MNTDTQEHREMEALSLLGEQNGQFYSSLLVLPVSFFPLGRTPEVEEGEYRTVYL